MKMGLEVLIVDWSYHQDLVVFIVGLYCIKKTFSRARSWI